MLQQRELHNLLGHREPDDAIQETMSKASHTLHAIDEDHPRWPQNPEAWLRRILRNTLVDMVRHDLDHAPAEALEGVPAPQQDPDYGMIVEELLRAYEQAKKDGRLTDEEVQIFEGQMWGSVADEAAKAGVAHGTIRNRRSGLLRKLRDLFREILKAPDVFDKKAADWLGEEYRDWNGDAPMMIVLERRFRDALTGLTALQKEALLADLGALGAMSDVNVAPERAAALQEAWAIVDRRLLGLAQILGHNRERYRAAITDAARNQGLLDVHVGARGTRVAGRAAADTYTDDAPATAMRVFVVKAISYETRTPMPGVFEELRAGRARIGWSYAENLDLRMLRDKITRGEELEDDENGARRCLRFLTEVEAGHLLLYPHQPERGLFTIVMVTGEYDYAPSSQTLGGDFRSSRPCAIVGQGPISLDDPIVPAQLRYRLQRPGRLSEIRDIEPLRRVLAAMNLAGQAAAAGSRPQRRRIADDLARVVPDLLRREWSQHDFTRHFCFELFEKMGLDTTVQEGPGDQGTDVLVTVSHPLLLDDCTVGVQAFAYEGDVSARALRGKLDQLLAGWDVNGLDQGVLLTTGICGRSATDMIHEHNLSRQDRRVRLIDGRELTEIFLRYFYT